MNNLSDRWLAMSKRFCLARRINFQRQPSTTNLAASRMTTADRTSSGRLAWMTINEHSVYILVKGSAVRTSQDIQRL